MDSLPSRHAPVNVRREAACPVSGDLPRTSAKKPPARSFDYTRDGEGAGVLVTAVGKRVTGYRCIEFVTGTGFDGRGFHLVKLFGGSDHEASDYQVFVAAEPHHHTCDCKGFTHHRHCTHVDALVELISRNAIDPQPARPARPSVRHPLVCAECAGHGFVPTADLGAAPCPVCGPTVDPYADADPATLTSPAAHPADGHAF